MNPLMVMMLAQTGVNLIGSINDANRAKDQTTINNMVADVNAAKETTNTMRSYTSAMEEITSRMKAQKSMFANAGVDTASTLFSKGLQAHEKSFLETKTGQSEALAGIQGNLSLTKAQNNYNLGATYKKLGTGVAMNLANSFMDYQHMSKLDKIQGTQNKGFGDMVGSLWGGK